MRATDGAGNTDTAVYAWTIEAPPPCPAPVTLVADADAWLDENSSTTNKGDDSILKVQSKAPRDNFRAVLHFPIPSLPSGCVVESATLSVYAASASPDRTLEVRRLAAGWSESTVTWSNQPQTVGAAVTAGSGTGYRDWAVTSLVQAGYISGANHGFLLRDEEEGGAGFEQQFHGREKGEAPPILVITYAPAGP